MLHEKAKPRLASTTLACSAPITLQVSKEGQGTLETTRDAGRRAAEAPAGTPVNAPMLEPRKQQPQHLRHPGQEPPVSTKKRQVNRTRTHGSGPLDSSSCPIPRASLGRHTGRLTHPIRAPNRRRLLRPYGPRGARGHAAYCWRPASRRSPPIICSVSNTASHPAEERRGDPCSPRERATTHGRRKASKRPRHEMASTKGAGIQDHRGREHTLVRLCLRRRP